MADLEKIDDPVWEYVLATKLTMYLPAVREFWQNIETLEVNSTGVYPVTNSLVKSCGIPAGLMYRVTNTPVRSPIKNVQVFPFVPVTYLQLTNIAGGAVRMVSRVCADNKFSLEEFVIVEKSNLPSTYHQGQFVAFVPKEVLSSANLLGKFVYLKHDEMINILQATGVNTSIRQKLIKYV